MILKVCYCVTVTQWHNYSVVQIKLLNCGQTLNWVNYSYDPYRAYHISQEIGEKISLFRKKNKSILECIIYFIHSLSSRLTICVRTVCAGCASVFNLKWTGCFHTCGVAYPVSEQGSNALASLRERILSQYSRLSTFHPCSQTLHQGRSQNNLFG